MRTREAAFGSVLALVAAGVLASCASDGSQEAASADAGGGAGSSSLGPNAGGGTNNAGGTPSGGKSGGPAAAGGASGGSRAAAGGSSAAGGAAVGGTDAGLGTGGAPACTGTTDVSLNDGTTGTGADQFEFQGTWSVSNAPEKYQGDDHYSATTGATATIHFDGRSVALHSAKASHHGIVEVSIDGGSPTDVDLYGATRAEDVEVWTSAPLSAASHVLTVRVSGRRNAESTGTTVSVDRVVVERPACNMSGTGGSNAGGAPGTGGTIGTGGAVGTSGTLGAGGTLGTGGTVGGTTTPRPAYNTGKGFFVVGRKLYDSKGVEFRIRGVNKLHWDGQSPGIPKTHANTERWVVDFTQTSATNLGLMQQSLDDHIVPMPGNWGGTCDEKVATLTTMVDTWVAQASVWKTLEPYMILNIANEWGPAGTVWRDSYITAVSRLRAAGYLSTISITSGGCGQDNADLATYAKAVFDSDPQKNVIFDQHIYGNWANGGGQSWQTDLNTGLDELVATGLPMIVGEFGPGRNIGPSATNMTPGEIIQACEARGIGWLAWAWDDPASNADDTWFALSKNGDYRSSADLTTFGKTVVENPTYGLLTLAHPVTSF